MALWGAGEATKPTWCTDDSPVADKQAVFATESGWVLRHYKKADQTEFWDEIFERSREDVHFLNASRPFLTFLDLF